MRIAFDVSPITAGRTGIGHYAASLLGELLHEPDVDLELYSISSKSVEVAGKKVKKIPLPARLVVTAWSAAGWPPAERFLGKVDLVHGTNFWVPPTRAARGIVAIHDLSFLFYPEMVSPQIRRYQWIVPKVLRRTTSVIAPCETIANQIVTELGVDRDRIVVTPYGVRGIFRDDAARSDVDGPYVIFAGGAEPRKNLARLAVAMKMIPEEVRLVVVGPGGPMAYSLQSLGQRVVDRGYVDEPTLASLVSGARAFVYPSIYEGFGLPPLEAMAAGVPVVAAAAGSLPEVLADAPFWCDPLDPASIAQAITSAIGDEQRRAVAIEKGRQRASEFTWQKTARATVDAYRLTLCM